MGPLPAPNPVPSRHLRRGRKARKANRETISILLSWDKPPENQVSRPDNDGLTPLFQSLTSVVDARGANGAYGWPDEKQAAPSFSCSLRPVPRHALQDVPRRFVKDVLRLNSSSRKGWMLDSQFGAGFAATRFLLDLILPLTII